MKRDLTLPTIPLTAKLAIEKFAGKGKILRVESVVRERVITYEAKVQKAGKKASVEAKPYEKQIRKEKD